MRKVAAVILVLVILLVALPVGSFTRSTAPPVRVAGHGGGELL